MAGDVVAASSTAVPHTPPFAAFVARQGECSQPTPRCRRTPLAALAVVAALCLVLYGHAAHRLRLLLTRGLESARVGDVVALAADPQEDGGNSSTCINYPHLDFEGCTHNNLAGKGPDQGEEGMVFRVKNKWTAHEFDLVVNALGQYTPFSPRMNGMSGEYGTLNIQSASSLTVRFSLRHHRSKAQISEPFFALTFFDLDQGERGTSQESVTINHFSKFSISDDHEPGSGSEVRVKKNGDGSRTFLSSTFGTGEDNPKHPLELDQEQKNRAVSVRWHNFSEAEATFAASSGPEPRFFTFVAYPALLCHKFYRVTIKKRLVNLVLNSPLEKSVVADGDDAFKEWFVKPGVIVQIGTALCSMTRQDQSLHVYRSPYDGEVVAIQAGLKQGDVLNDRLDDKSIVVVKNNMLQPLAVHGGEEPSVAPKDTTFQRYRVKEGDVVSEGDPIADLANSKGEVEALRASKDGVVTAIQGKLEMGDPVARVKDRNLAVIGRLRKLKVGPKCMAVNVPLGSSFRRFLVNVGEYVSVNSPVVEVEVDERVQQVESLTGGTVKARQERLRKGMRIDDAMLDHNVIVVGEEARRPLLPPLQVGDGVSPSNVPPGCTFLRWAKDRGDVVQEGDTLCEVRNADGVAQPLKAARAGIVTARQDGLKEGAKIDEVMEDMDLMTIGKLPPLEVSHGEMASDAPEGSTFKEYLVRPGDVVEENDPVALVTDPEGRVLPIKASKYGIVKARQEVLAEGTSIDEVMADRDLIVIGKFPRLEPTGPRNHVIDAPPHAIFEKYYVEMEQKVEVNDRLASVIIPLPGRRLQMAAAASHIQKVYINAPTWGTVVYLQPLKPGQRIEQQQVGPGIARLEQGLPWWLCLLAILLILYCCLYLLYGAMMKPTPAYTPMVPMEEPLVENEYPDGLRLDFQDGSRIKTVIAKRRPLGIKHNFVAPIVANDFTVNSYAKMELGVKEGWKLRRIGDEELHDNPNFDEVNGKLNDYMKDFELWPLPIDFKVTSSSTEVKTVEFWERPIGIEFTNRAPIKVSKVFGSSPAKAAGVEVGWCVMRIGEADVFENGNFREVMGYFNEGVQPLDVAGR